MTAGPEATLAVAACVVSSGIAVAYLVAPGAHVDAAVHGRPAGGPTGTTPSTGAEAPVGGSVPPADEGPRWPRRLVCLAAAGGSWALVGHAVGVAVAVVVAVLTWWLTGRLEPAALRRRRERLRRRLPAVVDLMAACLAVGMSPEAAVAATAEAVAPPMRDELRQAAARLRVAADPGHGWRHLARHPELAPLGRSMARAVESGASVADALARLATDLRRDEHADLEAQARAVGVKAALPLGICLLPAFVLLGIVPLVVGALPAVLHR